MVITNLDIFVRFEIMASGQAITELLDFQLSQPDTISIEEQPKLKEQAVQVLGNLFTLSFDGTSASPSMRRGDFLTLGHQNKLSGSRCGVDGTRPKEDQPEDGEWGSAGGEPFPEDIQFHDRAYTSRARGSSLLRDVKLARRADPISTGFYPAEKLQETRPTSSALE